MVETLEEKVTFSILIRDKRERVYDALTTADGLDAWFTSGASVDARPGGEIHFRWKDWGIERVTAENSGPVLEAVKPERFVFQWNSDDNSFMTTVEMDFAEFDKGTIVRLVEHGFPGTPQGTKNLSERASGWGHVMTLMKFYLEYGVKY